MLAGRYKLAIVGVSFSLLLHWAVFDGMRWQTLGLRASPASLHVQLHPKVPDEVQAKSDSNALGRSRQQGDERPATQQHMASVASSRASVPSDKPAGAATPSAHAAAFVIAASAPDAPGENWREMTQEELQAFARIRIAHVLRDQTLAEPVHARLRIEAGQRGLPQVQIVEPLAASASFRKWVGQVQEKLTHAPDTLPPALQWPLEIELVQE